MCIGMANGDVFCVGAKVWTKHAKACWIKGTVVKLDGDQLHLQLENDEALVCDSSNCHLQNCDREYVEDMTTLSFLHEPGVLWNLKSRFLSNHIYTYTGSILIAINPFAPLPELYGPDVIEDYREALGSNVPPHVYAVASSAYKQMRRDNAGQAILVTGESGAGKTETSKLIMKYLAHLGGEQRSNWSNGGADMGNISIDTKVLESNPLLEAFGNAKTVRNDNSSRFGKYVEINFNKEGCISGAAIRTYLLERSRVVHLNNPERNYHVFYQLCYGASEEEKQRLHLLPPQHFRFLNQSSCYELAGVNNADEYKRTRRAMSCVALSGPQQDQVFRVVATVLHLGNTEFIEEDEATRSAPGGPEQHLGYAAELLGVSADDLLRCLTTRTRQTPEGPIVSPLSAQAAQDTRDALAKVLYSKLFDWIVEQVNVSMGEDLNAASSVGLLDIYGFESFEFNDFEQLCINLANEKLQQHFNTHVFKWEQAEYEKDGIDWSYIEFVDNQDVLDLIEGRLGLLEMLDEQCRFPTATGEDLVTKYVNCPIIKESKRFTKLKRPSTAFSVEHYAGAVAYCTDNFLDKNKDYIIAEHQAMLAASSCPLVATMFAFETPGDGSSSAPSPGTSTPPPGPNFKAFQFKSVASQFKRQLNELMTKLGSMSPHYVRCIKPNPASAPLNFDNSYVLQQLRCGGVMEAVRISCAGFPYKRPFADFVETYWQLCPAAHKSVVSGGDAREAAVQLLQAVGQANTAYQCGNTKVFLRAGGAAVLEQARTTLLYCAACRIQTAWRRHWAERQYRALRQAALIMQVASRARLARGELARRRMEASALTLQAAWRARQARHSFVATCQAASRLQAAVRARRSHLQYQETRREWAAVLLQSAWRARKEHRRLWHSMYASKAAVARRQAAEVIQAAWRGRAERRKYQELVRQQRAAQVITRVFRVLHARKERQRMMQEMFKSAERRQRFEVAKNIFKSPTAPLPPVPRNGESQRRREPVVKKAVPEGEVVKPELDPEQRRAQLEAELSGFKLKPLLEQWQQRSTADGVRDPSPGGTPRAGSFHSSFSAAAPPLLTESRSRNDSFSSTAGSAAAAATQPLENGNGNGDAAH